MSVGACANVRSLLPLYLEHEADPAEALEAASHLLRCSDCSAEADRERDVIRALRSLDAPEPPRDIASGVLGRLRGLKAKVGSSAALKWSAIVGVLAFLLLRLSVPDHSWGTGVRFLARLGELIDLDLLLDRLLDTASRFLPSPSSLVGGFPGADGGIGGAPAMPGHWIAPMAVLLIASSLLCALLVGGAIFLSRDRSRA